MKILLDENIPHDLRPLLSEGHEVFTVAYLGWQAAQNGELLRKAAESGFDVMVTTDAGFEFEQNVQAFPLAIVVLRGKTNTMKDLAPLVPEVLHALQALRPGTLVCVGASS